MILRFIRLHCVIIWWTKTWYLEPVLEVFGRNGVFRIRVLFILCAVLSWIFSSVFYQLTSFQEYTKRMKSRFEKLKNRLCTFSSTVDCSRTGLATKKFFLYTTVYFWNTIQLVPHISLTIQQSLKNQSSFIINWSEFVCFKMSTNYANTALLHYSTQFRLNILELNIPFSLLWEQNLSTEWLFNPLLFLTHQFKTTPIS